VHVILLSDDPELVHIAQATPVRLHPGDRDLLLLLADRRVHSAAEIYDLLFGERLIEPGAIYSRLSRLQRQLGAKVLRTVISRGSMLRDDCTLAVALFSPRGGAYMPPPVAPHPLRDTTHDPIN
jgi:hypothetical protein